MPDRKAVRVPMEDAHMAVVQRYNPTTKQNEEDRVNLGSGHLTFPFDLPTYMTVDRLMEVQADGTIEQGNKGGGRTAPLQRALKGWTLTVDAYTFGVKVYIRIGRDGTLKVFAEDGDGIERIGEWEK